MHAQHSGVIKGHAEQQRNFSSNNAWPGNEVTHQATKELAEQQTMLALTIMFSQATSKDRSHSATEDSAEQQCSFQATRLPIKQVQATYRLQSREIYRIHEVLPRKYP